MLKKEIDHSTLYNFDAPFRLTHADVGNLEFLGKNAAFPQYVWVLVDLFSSKIYTYPMKSRKQIRQKLQQFYEDVRGKRKGRKMKLQVDQELQQVKIKDLNELNNVQMFSTSLRGGKAFAAEQKIRELKTRNAKLNSQKLKISPKKIIEMSTINMNIQPSKKYGLSPDEVEKKGTEKRKIQDSLQYPQNRKNAQVESKNGQTRQKKVCQKAKKAERKPQYWRKSICSGRKNKEEKCFRKIL